MSSDIKLTLDGVFVQASGQVGFMGHSAEIDVKGVVRLRTTSASKEASVTVYCPNPLRPTVVEIQSDQVKMTGTGSYPQTLSLQSKAGFGSSRVEFRSDVGTGNEWRPVFFESFDRGNFTGGLRVCVNGTGPSSKEGTVEIMRISNKSVNVDGDISAKRFISTQSPGSLDLVDAIKKLLKEVEKLQSEVKQLQAKLAAL